MIDNEVRDLEAAVDQIWSVATSTFGLDPFPVRFEIVPASVMYEVGSYALPGRYSHWTFGKAYHRMKMMYDFGLSKIYEVVINSNPSYAFLLETNSPTQNKMVIAHVLGHVDFFKNNAYFARTNRRMIDEAALHARRMAEYEFKYGRKVVEEFLDAVLSIDEHVDPNFFIKRRRAEDDKKQEKPKRRDGPYDDLLTLEERRASESGPADEEGKHKPSIDAPEKDLVYFILKNSPVLEDWHKDIMSMLHEEMEYFIPQMQTKIMNEGWASIWHSRIMRELELPTSEHLEFAELHAGVVSPHKGQLNPYYLGYKLFEDIEKRWDNPTQEERDELGRTAGTGREKIMEIRELENDVSFLRNYLTEDLCEEMDLFIYELVDDEEWTVTEKGWEAVRDRLVANMTNFGFPYIEVVDGDYDGNRELYLMHRYEGVELDMKYARKTLECVYKLWGRDVHLETVSDNEPLVMHYDGNEHDED
ncbi:MAG TPA: SpoVR family protein [Blastocatellia bacterium]|nr:SpoVR family protein [Blastocatellia bacterium]